MECFHLHTVLLKQQGNELAVFLILTVFHVLRLLQYGDSLNKTQYQYGLILAYYDMHSIW